MRLEETMNEIEANQPGQPTSTGEPSSARAYQPPRVEKLGSLRDLLAAKSGVNVDNSPVHPDAKN